MFDILRIYKKLIFWISADRIGPDMPLTHWLFHFKSLGRALAKKKFAEFGSSFIRHGVYVIGCSKISIGNHVVLRPGTMIHANPEIDSIQIIIEDKVLIGSGVHFYVDKHSFNDTRVPIYDQGFENLSNILVKEGSWIGANSIILPGVTIGQNAVVGAGSVVTKSIPDFCVAVGNPARVIKRIKEDSQ